MNWYLPEHNIGLHSDDEISMNNTVPIISLSWGGPRRFILRPKNANAGHKVKEFSLHDGDLFIMGGLCQKEFKHEVPKVRKTKDLAGNRISWTVRSMNHTARKSKSHTQHNQQQQQQRRQILDQSTMLESTTRVHHTKHESTERTKTEAAAAAAIKRPKLL
jgi:hypothetical protein